MEMDCCPIFIVGCPRSGTKLLREFFNNHPQVSIPKAETGFIPYLSKNVRKYGNLGDKNNFSKLYHDVSRSTFFSYMPDAIKIWDKDQWYNSIRNSSIGEAISAFYWMHAKYEGKSIWGDKTPSYMLYIPLIKKLFPNAKIIHIHRDVRDYCLSMRKTWGKNIYRAAERWVRDIKKCKMDGGTVGEDSYFELTYERLVQHTEREMRKVCDFCEIEFEPQMIFLRCPVENLGDAKGRSEVLRQNHGKWKTQLTTTEVKKIEELAGSLLSSLGYGVKYVYGNKRLGFLSMFYYQFLDSIHLFIFRWKTQASFLETLKWIARHKKYMP